MSHYRGRPLCRFYESTFMSQGKRCNKVMGSFAIFCQEGPRKVYIRCMHNSRHRPLFLNSGLNSFCLCHVGQKCILELGTDTRAREVLVEIKEGNVGRQVFLLYEGNKEQSYTEVGSLQNMAITAIFKNKGESLLRDNSIVPSSIAKEIEESTFCAIPYCIFSTITMCTRRCLIKGNLCDLEASKPYPWVFSNTLSRFSLGTQMFPTISCLQSHLRVSQNFQNFE